MIDLTLVPPHKQLIPAWLYLKITRELLIPTQELRWVAQSRKKAVLEGVKRRRRQRAIISVIVAVLLIAIVVVGVYALFGPKSEYRQYIPANIGLSPNCNKPLHTHDDTGTIHVETDENRDYVLNDFFLIWGKTFNSSGIFASNQPLPSYLNRCVTASLLYHSHPVLTIIYNTKAPSTLTMTVNGNPETSLQNFVLPRDTGANPANIIITYGPGLPASL